MLVLDDVDGAMPAIPWRPSELSRVMSALEPLAAALTPAPSGVKPITEDLAENFRSWRALAGDPVLAARLSGWERDRLADLEGLESGWADAAWGGTLLHADLRADNLLLTADGGVMVIDWPYAVAGAAWVDALLFLVSAAAEGADPALAWAAAAGDFVCQSLLPAPQNLPSLRGHQRAKSAAAVQWLRSRVRWR